MGSEPLLVLRALGLGDALTGIAALRALRRMVAPRPLLLAAPSVIGGWLQQLGEVDAVVPTPDLDADPPGRALGVHDADDLHGNGPASRDLLAAAGPRRLLAFADPASRVEWRADEHEVARWLRLVASIGAEGSVDDLRLRSLAEAEAARGHTVVVHPGAAFASRRWPVERWAEVVRRLAADGHPVTVTLGPGEGSLGRELLDDHLRGAVTLQQADLPALARTVGAARLLLCGDTGVAHLATALAVPSVLLFGPIAPDRWGPAIDHERHTLIWHGDGTGDPHGCVIDPALARTTPDEVVAAADDLLRRWRPAAPPVPPSAGRSPARR